MKKKRFRLFQILLIFFTSSLSCQTANLTFKEHQIKFDSNGVTLEGIFYESKKHQSSDLTVIFVHGSSPTSRKDRYYNYLKDSFLEKGFNVFLYDKRGNGKSGGINQDPADFNLLAEDVVAVTKYLKANHNSLSKKIGIIGTSQGGWVGPLAASKTENISFVVTISGPGTNTFDQMLFQKKEKLIHYNVSQYEIDEAMEYLKKLYTYLSSSVGYENILKLNKNTENKSWYKYLESHEQNIYPPNVVSNHEAFKGFKPEFSYDPKLVLENINIPFLAVFGDKDRITPVHNSIERIKKITTASGNKKHFTIKVFKNSGHLLQLVEGEKEIILNLPEVTDFEREMYMTKFKQNLKFVKYLLNWVHKQAIKR